MMLPELILTTPEDFLKEQLELYKDQAYNWKMAFTKMESAFNSQKNIIEAQNEQIQIYKSTLEKIEEINNRPIQNWFTKLFK